ncbi:MAG: caspase family protein, partial [Devosia sp.]
MFRLAALATALMLSVPAWAQELKGFALVIGESKYETLSELVNPNQDARDIDDLLGDLGFDVDRVLNADAEELREAIEEFIEDAKDADVALVYYSGHGIEVGGQNYIVPVDATFDTPEAAGGSLVAVAPLLEALAKTVPVTIVLLDACRSDPFPVGTIIKLPDSGAPITITATEPGLAPVRGPTPAARPDLPPESLGTVIGFAAEPGQPALDGPAGENSPYAAALLKHLSAGGFSFGDVMTMVTEEVYLKTKAQQLPWTNSSLRRVLTFAAPEETDPDESAITSERRKLLLTIAGTPAVTRTYVEALAAEEAVPLDALYGMLDVLGVDPEASDTLEDQLRTGATRLKELIASRSPSVKSDPELERLSKLAEAAESEGAIALALKYRDEASAHADTLLANKQSEADRLRQDMLDIAGTYAANATTAVINFDHLHAADLFGKAYEAVKDWDEVAALGYKISQGDALSDRGYYHTDNAALTAALAAYDQAAALAPRDSAPSDWAKIEDRVGQAMQVLGERLADPATLRASIAHYEAALAIRTEAAAPIEWAKSKNNLANALYSLGARNNDADLLAQSIPAFDASMKVFTPEAEPIRWATVANNLAASQTKLAEVTFSATSDAEMAAMMAGEPDPTNIPVVKAAREAANVSLDKAIDSTRAALATGLRKSNPLGWAMLQHTLATALVLRGEMNHMPDAFREAVVAYRAVLEVHTKEQTPAQWVRTTNNLAIALKNLSDETDDVVPLREAIPLYQSVIEMTPREQSPLDWADYQENLGNALAILSDYEKSPEPLTRALAAYALAGEVTTIERGAAKWQQLQISISTTLLMQSLLTFDKSKA